MLLWNFRLPFSVAVTAFTKRGLITNSYVENPAIEVEVILISAFITFIPPPPVARLLVTLKTKRNAVMWVVSVLPTRVVNGSCLLHRWFIDCHDRGHLSFSAFSSRRHYMWRASSGSSIVWCMGENGNGMVVVMISSRLDTRASKEFKWSNISQPLSFFCLSLYKQHGPYACTRKGYL